MKRFLPPLIPLLCMLCSCEDAPNIAEPQIQTVTIPDGLRYQTIRKALAQAPERKVILGLPRFKHEQTVTSLKNVLQLCGMHSGFSPSADFYGWSNDKLWIEDIAQCCKVEANEAGIEATAATIASFTSYKAGQQLPPVTHRHPPR